MDEKKCVVEFLPDEKFGWKIKPGEGCEAVFKKVEENLGPHGNRYLDVRKVEVPKENKDEQPHQAPE